MAWSWEATTAIVAQHDKGFATTTRNPIAPWRGQYGRFRVGGTVVNFNEWGDNAKMWDMVIIGRAPMPGGYAAFTVSGSRATAVREYIAGQQEHHRRVSFQEEFLTFLQKHGIPYDALDLWG